MASRNRASAKKAGATFERKIADHLAISLDDDRVDRRVKTGAKDRGDIAGVRTIRGGRVVLECKDYGGQYQVTPWLREAETERGNDDAIIGAVIAKRRGIADPGQQVVMMTVDTFINLLQGGGDVPYTVVDDPTVATAELPESIIG